LRFLDRKVFFSVVVLLVPVLHERPSAQRLERLQELFQVSVRTLRRWQRWWREQFAAGPVMTFFQGLCADPIDRAGLPGSLLRALRQESTQERVLTVLRVLLVGPFVQVQ
jgi:hypothetical protein